jgi:hypothetical protein
MFGEVVCCFEGGPCFSGFILFYLIFSFHIPPCIMLIVLAKEISSNSTSKIPNPLKHVAHNSFFVCRHAVTSVVVLDCSARQTT